VKAVVGLGNPGARYANTRHNVGFWVVDLLAGSAGWRENPTFLVAEASPANTELLLVKPTTYMNSSGDAVMAIVQQYELVPEDVIVVVDDVHLPLGRLRLRRSGTHGGHNGLRSIIEEWSTGEFPRLRLGVGQPDASDVMIDHVLGAFDADEMAVMQDVVHRAADGVICWATSGIESAMNRFNSLMVERNDAGQ